MVTIGLRYHVGIDRRLTVDIDLLQHRAQFLGPRELSEGAHHPAQLLLRNAPVAVLVEQPERLPEFCNNEVPRD